MTRNIESPRIAGILALALLAGCGGELLPTKDGFMGTCRSNADCEPNSLCVSGLCVREARSDAGEPPADYAQIWWPSPDSPSPSDSGGGSTNCVPGTKRCGMQCIPNGWCCTNNDCTAAGQTCQIDGSCQCPAAQKACLQVCIPNGNCCTNDDCPSKLCSSGTCTIPSCKDGVPNGSESDVDCGGSCPPCLLNRNCIAGGDCRSNACMGAICVEPGFRSASYGGGSYPTFIRAGDLDSDGKVDLIALNTDGTAAVGSQNLSVLLGRGDGTFVSIGSFATGLAPVHAALADLNGDGRLDAVVANAASNDLSVLIGYGDGMFRPQVKYPTGAGPRWVAVGDQNHDGRPDIVVANQTTGSFGLLLGNGNGTFKSQVQTFTFAYEPSSIVLRDFNGDGFDDVAVQCVGVPPPGTVGFTNGVLSVYTSKPAGGFLAPVNYATATRTLTSLFAMDTNGDKQLDLLVGGAGMQAAMVFRGTGKGTFLFFVMLDKANSVALEPADMNGDKMADLVSGSGIHMGKGGFFQAALPYAGAGIGISSLAVADFNLDGKQDIAWPEAAKDSIHVLFGNGDGTMGDPLLDPRSATDTDISLISPRAVGVADLDGDGRGDVLVASATTRGLNVPDLLVHLTNVDGTLRSASHYAIGNGNSPSAIAVADFNGDQRLDVVVANAAEANLQLLLGQGKGQLAPAKAIAAGATLVAMTVADLDRDGAMDVVAATNGADVIYLLGHNDGTFSPPQSIPVGNEPRQVVVYDWNGDGKPDLLTPNRGSLDVSLVIGRGVDGKGVLSFDAAVSVTPPGPALRPVALGVADLDKDGRPDLMIADNAMPVMRVYLNTSQQGGPVAFAMPSSNLLAAIPAAGLLGDLDLDGNLDFVTVNSGDRSVTVLGGAGKGAFAKAVNYDVGVGPVAVAAGDINGDKRLDLVTANRTAGTITVMLGR